MKLSITVEPYRPHHLGLPFYADTFTSLSKSNTCKGEASPIIMIVMMLWYRAEPHNAPHHSVYHTRVYIV